MLCGYHNINHQPHSQHILFQHNISEVRQHIHQKNFFRITPYQRGTAKQGWNHSRCHKCKAQRHFCWVFTLMRGMRCKFNTSSVLHPRCAFPFNSMRANYACVSGSPTSIRVHKTRNEFLSHLTRYSEQQIKYSRKTQAFHSHCPLGLSEGYYSSWTFVDSVADKANVFHRLEVLAPRPGTAKIRMMKK